MIKAIARGLSYLSLRQQSCYCILALLIFQRLTLVVLHLGAVNDLGKIFGAALGSKARFFDCTSRLPRPDDILAFSLTDIFDTIGTLIGTRSLYLLRQMVKITNPLNWIKSLFRSSSDICWCNYGHFE